MENAGEKTVLLVDDEEDILDIITTFLRDEEGYKILNASNGKDALDILSSHRVDLVLSDINMPMMKGFELLNEVKKKYPDIIRVLITAYNTEDYVGLALKHDISNIFVKTTPFNFNELSQLLQKLLTQDIFGASRYFKGNYNIHREIVKKGASLDRNAGKIISCLPDKVVKKKLDLVLVELLTNAVFYGVRRENPEKKHQWDYGFKLSEEEAVNVDILWNNEMIALSINDSGGTLRKEDVLYWLGRQFEKDEDGLPKGMHDTHGRGIYLCRRYIDRLIVNIKKNIRTEIIAINYLNNIYKGYKPIYINEI